MAKITIKELRDFPSIEELLQSPEIAKHYERLPRTVVASIVKDAIEAQKIMFRHSNGPMPYSDVIDKIRKEIAGVQKASLGRVINATGIIIHTNLGRAPLSESLFDAIKQTITGYGNIEYDLETGRRGKRGALCEKYLAQLSGAEAATVVNNNAGALFLILNTLAIRKRVVISRGELVQIGGGFRIPDILKRSGARLCEVGTTNITTVDDYTEALVQGAHLILKVHKSNFIQAGFARDVSLRDLTSLAHKSNNLVINDLGSGCFVPTRKLLGFEEPTVQQSVHDGADLTCFSGDKLLGGVQAGLIVGRAELISKLKKNPLFRILRVDKIVFAALEYMLTSYLDGTYESKIKLWSILATPESVLYTRARKLLDSLGNPETLSAAGTAVYVGGGSMPQTEVPSVAIVFARDYSPDTAMRWFRELNTSIIGRIQDERFMLDLKTVGSDDLEYLTQSIKSFLSRA